MYQDKTNWDTVYFSKTSICHEALSTYACKEHCYPCERLLSTVVPLTQNEPSYFNVYDTFCKKIK